MQSKGKKGTAYIVADLEASTGVWRKNHTLLGREWQEARVELTRDINAAAEALFLWGAEKVVVKDFHRTGFNAIPSQLDRRVNLVSGYYIGPATGYGELHGADFALFLGLHASGGNANGFLPHTLTSRIAEIRVNGKRVCEAELFANVLSEFGVPVAFFSGCPAACEEVKERMPWVRTYAVPKDPAVYEDEEKRKRQIAGGRKGLGEAIMNLPDPRSLPLFFMPGPFDCRVIFQTEEEARRADSWGFPREGRVIAFHVREFRELYLNLLKIAYFPKWAYALRRLVVPLTRLAWRIHSWKHL